jgi:hypothetical protein
MGHFGAEKCYDATSIGLTCTATSSMHTYQDAWTANETSQGVERVYSHLYGHVDPVGPGSHIGDIS